MTLHMVIRGGRVMVMEAAPEELRNDDCSCLTCLLLMGCKRRLQTDDLNDFVCDHYKDVDL